MDNVRTLIQKLAASGRPQGAQVCIVTAVDRTKRTIDAEPLAEGAPLLDVNLQANQGGAVGFVQFPKVGSFVVVVPLGSYEAAVCVLMDEVEETELTIGQTKLKIDGSTLAINGGGNGGMVKVQELTQKLNAIENDINSLRQAIAAWVPVAQDGGAALKAACTAWTASTLTPTQKTEIENSKALH